MTQKQRQNTCSEGHTFYKRSDCLSCPQCEAGQKPTDGFLAQLVAPARRALQQQGIDTLDKLATYSEAEILQLHGMGPSSLPRLRSALSARGLHFKASLVVLMSFLAYGRAALASPGWPLHP